MLPWQKAPAANEVNLSFILENNLMFLPSATLNGRPGHYFFASASPRTVLSPLTADALGSPRRYAFGFGQRESARFNPLVADLGHAGDAMIGADVIGSLAVTIDYHAGLLTLQESGIQPAYMSLYRFTAEPMITVDVDGRPVTAIVDTASPDTLILPSDRETRGRVSIGIAGSDFGVTDVRYSRVPEARVGNRLLARFLVAIDYGHHVVGLWRDPRNGGVAQSQTPIPSRTVR